MANEGIVAEKPMAVRIPDGEPFMGIDPYEREKVETTISDLERAASALRLYLCYHGQLDRERLMVDKTAMPNMAALRVPGGVAGPGCDIHKVDSMASKCMESIRRQLPRDLFNQVVRGAEAAHKAINRS